MSDIALEVKELVRNTDPETSLESAIKAARASTKAVNRVRIAYSWERDHLNDGMTDEE